MQIHVVGLLDNEEQAKEVKFIAKLLLIGIRTQELSKEARQIDFLIDDTINMYTPKEGEK